MLNVTIKFIMPSVIFLSVIILNVIMLNFNKVLFKISSNLKSENRAF